MDNYMNNKTLVTYASKYGATAEIAEKIGEVLNSAGLKTDVLSIKQVSDPSQYNAVILGSAVYIGQWRKEAVKFLEANKTELTKKQVWLFSSGPTGEGDPVELLEGWDFPKGQKEIADRIQPQDITVFHGSVEPNKLNFLHKWMIGKVDAPVGDFRDWEAITSWATSIAVALTEA
jgi:menaquinone-dependent protoporphyrinogen oxidase